MPPLSLGLGLNNRLSIGVAVTVLSDIQRILLSDLDLYVNGDECELLPALTGYGPFEPISLDDGANLVSAEDLATRLQDELETDGDLAGKVTVVGEDIDDSVTSGCVLRLKLDETSGTTAADSSGNANNGTHTGTVAASTTTAPNRKDSVRSAQYTAAYTSVPNSASLDITGAFSITGWMYWTGGAFAYNPILSKWNTAGTTGFGLSLDGGTNTLRFDSYAGGSGSNIKGDTVLSANTWYFVAATRASGGAAKIYLNASVDKSGTLASAPGSISDEVRVGSDKSTGGRVWTGLLDDVRLYNRELSADEVAEIMFSKMQLTCTFDASLGDVPEMTISRVATGELQKVTLTDLHNYEYGTGHEIVPAITGYGPFDPVSLDNSGEFITPATLASNFQTELETDSALTGNVTVTSEIENIDAPNQCVIHARFNNDASNVSGYASSPANGTAQSDPRFVTDPPPVLDALGWTHSLEIGADINDAYNAGYWFEQTSGTVTLAQFSMGGWYKMMDGPCRGFLTLQDGSGPLVRFLVGTNGTDFNQITVIDPDGNSGDKMTTSHGAGTWVHVFFTSSVANGNRIYLNGELHANWARTYESVEITGLAVGAYRLFGSSEGQALRTADVRLYERELGAHEVELLALGGDNIVLNCEFDPSLGDIPTMSISQPLTLTETVVADGTPDYEGSQEQVQLTTPGGPEFDDTTVDSNGNTIQWSGGFFSYSPAIGWSFVSTDGNTYVNFICDSVGPKYSSPSSGSGNVTVTSAGQDPSPGSPEIHLITPNRKVISGTYSLGGESVDADEAPVITGWNGDQQLSFGPVTMTATSNGDTSDVLSPTNVDLVYSQVTANVTAVHDPCTSEVSIAVSTVQEGG